MVVMGIGIKAAHGLFISRSVGFPRYISAGDRLCGLVVRVYGFDSRRYQIF
jgi:hypothetical protein